VEIPESHILKELVDRRVLVCGATGFLGRALCRRLVAGGVRVHGTSRRPQRDASEMSWYQVDLTDTAATSRLVAAVRPDVLFNLSGISDARPDRDRVLPVFVGGGLVCVNLLAAAAEYGCGLFVHTSSLQEADFGSGDARPVSPYALAKFVETAYVDLFQRMYQLPAVVLRFGIVYGPGERTVERFIPHVITALLRGEQPRLSLGRQTADWLYVEDAVDALVSTAVSPAAKGCVLNVGSGTPTSVRTMAERIAAAVDNGVSPVFGAVADRPTAPTRPAEPSRVKEVLGWTPRTCLDDGLRATIEWYRERL
jgi:UDP-glucose 4-epimerase